MAVSGGLDSLALAFLADRWARPNQAQLTAVTVDHRLRPESAAEAAQVGRWLAARGIEHRILHREGPAPTTGLQAAARGARYRLLTEWCRRHRIRDLLLAHHLQDQAETFLLRLARGSANDGLAAMAPLTVRDGVRLLRPLLQVPRARLAATLRAAGQGDWVDDPSNRDRRFARVRARQWRPEPAKLATAAAVRARVRAGRDTLAMDLGAAAVRWHTWGAARLSPSPLVEAPREIAARVLSDALRLTGGRALPPSPAAVLRLLRKVGTGRAGTLHGCVLTHRNGQAWLVREPRNLPALALVPGESALWDGRFLATYHDGPLTGAVRALGPDGWRQVGKRTPDTPLHPGRTALPALWIDGCVAAAPHLGYAAPGIRFAAEFRESPAVRCFAVVGGGSYPI